MVTRLNGIALDGSEPVPRALTITTLAIGLPLWALAAWLAWGEIAFIRATVAVPGQVVGMADTATVQSDGRRTNPTYAPVFTFTTRDGTPMRLVSPVSSNPPCCEVGEAVSVRYPPADPTRARIVSLRDSWIMPAMLGIFGLFFVGPGLMAARAHRTWLREAAMPEASRPRRSRLTPPEGPPPPGISLPVPLVGLRRSETRYGPRWYVQARWTNPQGGEDRLFESEDLPFDPTLQMRDMDRVRVIFQPSKRGSPYRMDLSFLRDPEQHPDAMRPAGPEHGG